MIPPLPLIDGCLFLDNSSWMENIMTCHRRLEYSQLLRRISSAESTALNFGTAIHSALDLRYKIYGNQPVDFLYNDQVASVLSTFFDLHPSPLADHRTLNHAMEIVKRYNDKYQTEAYEFDLLEYDEPVKCNHCMGLGYINYAPVEDIYPNEFDKECVFCSGTRFQKLMVELPFALHLYDHTYSEAPSPFPTIPIFYSGRIDLPLLRGSNIFVMDHKTTSMLGKGFFDEKKMSAQQKGYCWAFEQLTGKKVHGYAINAIRTLMPTQATLNGKPNRKDEIKTLEDFWDESLQREWFYLSDGELDEWKNNTIDLIEEFFWHYARGYMPMKTAWCVGKFGQCPYLDVCSLHPASDRKFMLESGNFQDNVWSPLIQPSQGKVST